jgi:hypothetical protein
MVTINAKMYGVPGPEGELELFTADNIGYGAWTHEEMKGTGKNGFIRLVLYLENGRDVQITIDGSPEELVKFGEDIDSCVAIANSEPLKEGK